MATPWKLRRKPRSASTRQARSRPAFAPPLVAGANAALDAPFGTGAWPDSAELDVAHSRAGLGTRADVADRHPLHAAGVVDQHDVPQPLSQHRLDLQADVEPGIDGLGEVPHRGHGTGLAGVVQ